MSKIFSVILACYWLVKRRQSTQNQMKAFFSFLFTLCCITSLSAQNTMGLNFQAVFPTGELKTDSPEIWGGGVALTGAFNIKQSPIYLGGTIDFSRYGSEVKDGWHGTIMGDYRHRRQFEMSRLLGFIRVSPDCDAGFFPYVDFTAGVNYVYTRSILRTSAVNEPFDRYLDIDDFSFTYGLGAGIEIPLGNEVLLDLNFKTLKSGKMEYLTPASVNYDREQEAYVLDIQNSRLDNFTISFGIKAYIN